MDNIEEKKEEIKLPDGIRPTDVVGEMKSSYINYAMSVIVARALPDIRDGLKPVQRRILYSMYKQGIIPGKGYKKSARIVGDVIGKYHPHGDVAVYDTMVRMVQEFSLRYPLVDGQGNFGSIDGDGAAAMRYTEAKLSHFAMTMIDELDSYTVDFRPNYDGNYMEPIVLPALLPQLLLNGGEGIAVGMATKIPPHNVSELIAALLEILGRGNVWEAEAEWLKNIKNYAKGIKTTADLEKLDKSRFPQFETDVTLDELFKIIPGPDFPTKGVIYDQKEIKNMYATGKGRVLMRGVAKIEESKGGKFEIIISELPYQVNKARLVAKIAELVKDKKIEGVSDIRDESDRDIRVIIEIKRDGKPNVILNNLFKYTELQKAFNANMLCLVNNEPKVLSLKRILELFITHRQEISIRKSEYELAKAQERIHILEGLKIALDNLDAVIKLIRESKDSDTAKEGLMKKFKLSEIQATAILDMQLRRLAALERKKIEEEYKALKATVDTLIALLSDPSKIVSFIKDEIMAIKDKVSDERRTKIHKGALGEVSDDDLVAKENVIVSVSEQGYIKRIKENVYSVQNRGGKGKIGMTTKEDDAVAHVFSCSTHDNIMFFTNKGRVFESKVYDIPEFGRSAKGQAIVNIINIEPSEKITSILTHSNGKFLDEEVIQEGEEQKEREGKDYKFLFMATKKGTVKKTLISEYENIRNNGLIAIKLEKDDELIWVKPTTGNDEILIVTKMAKSIHFKESDVNETGRSTMGVRGIKFAIDSDEVISMDVIREGENMLLTVTEHGFGKITKIKQFGIQNRGGSGIFAHDVSKKTGDLVAARVMDHPEKELLIMSEKGQSIRISAKDLPERNRQTSGVHLIRFNDSSDKVAAIAII
jgi:DNA gyrase subunit A